MTPASANFFLVSFKKCCTFALEKTIIVYKYLGYYFRFYSNEHEPIHVHVQANGRESIMELIMNNNQLQKVNVRPKRGAEPLNAKELAIAREFVEK